MGHGLGAVAAICVTLGFMAGAGVAICMLCRDKQQAQEKAEEKKDEGMENLGDLGAETEGEAADVATDTAEAAEVANAGNITDADVDEPLTDAGI